MLEIHGIGEQRLQRIRQSWEEQKEVRKLMLFLTEHGITSGRAVRIYRTYGQEAIAKIKANPYQLHVDFEGRSVAYDFGDLDELSLAYVLSIHKSQGSEFPCVVIPLHTQHYLMLQRNLLYTAITRGKRLVILVGTKKALGMAVRRADTGQRHTTLRKRLQESQQLV